MKFQTLLNIFISNFYVLLCYISQTLSIQSSFHIDTKHLFYHFSGYYVPELHVLFQFHFCKMEIIISSSPGITKNRRNNLYRVSVSTELVSYISKTRGQHIIVHG